MSTISTFVLKRDDDVTLHSEAEIGHDFFLGGRTVNAPLDNVDFLLFLNNP